MDLYGNKIYTESLMHNILIEVDEHSHQGYKPLPKAFLNILKEKIQEKRKKMTKK